MMLADLLLRAEELAGFDVDFVGFDCVDMFYDGTDDACPVKPGCGLIARAPARLQ
jgi:hypothetical protein